jgi:hypothetical protein
MIDEWKRTNDETNDEIDTPQMDGQATATTTTATTKFIEVQLELFNLKLNSI